MPPKTPGGEASRALASRTGAVHEIRVTLDGVKPEVWRQVAVPSDFTLADLHDVLQLAMGWTNSHLHHFLSGSVRYAPPGPEDELDYSTPTLDTATAHVFEVLHGSGSRLIYEYDFGDGWEHLVETKVVRPARKGEKVPRCMAGARACPPEDCGGYGGYADILAAIRDPKDPAHEEMLRWFGGAFDPEALDLVETNGLLLTYSRRRSAWLRRSSVRKRGRSTDLNERIDLLARILEARDEARDKARRVTGRGWILAEPR